MQTVNFFTKVLDKLRFANLDLLILKSFTGHLASGTGVSPLPLHLL
jgi:hypothetical protein